MLLEAQRMEHSACNSNAEEQMCILCVRLRLCRLGLLSICIYRLQLHERTAASAPFLSRYFLLPSHPHSTGHIVGGINRNTLSAAPDKPLSWRQEEKRQDKKRQRWVEKRWSWTGATPQTRAPLTSGNSWYGQATAQISVGGFFMLSKLWQYMHCTYTNKFIYIYCIYGISNVM